jgi:hypothetical protein
LGDSNGLGLAFWAETPSGKFEELADMKTRKMSRGDETAYKAKLKPKEDGYHTVFVNLYDDHRLNSSKISILLSLIIELMVISTLLLHCS